MGHNSKHEVFKDPYLHGCFSLFLYTEHVREEVPCISEAPVYQLGP